MKEIDVPQTAIDTLLEYVYSKVKKEDIGLYPFYMKVSRDLMYKSFGDFLNVDNISTAYIYAHDEPIPLHVDRYKVDANFNLCVPLYTTDSNQKFIVFDQIFDRCGCEWQAPNVSQKRHQPATPEDKSNSNDDNDHVESICYKGIRPCDTDGIVGLTDRAVNNDLQNVLPFDIDFYHGLTGNAWNWKPGKGLVFKSSQLHTTAAQTEFKIGCVLLMKSEDCLLNP